MNGLLYWITGFLPTRFINDGNVRYLERYYLFTFLGWTFYLHRFVGSDPDRGLHDHPWSRAFSIILSGWYFEETRSGTSEVRWFNALTGDTFHRVVLPEYWQVRTDDYPLRWLLDGEFEHHPELRVPQPCWTLFLHRTPNVKKWGFLNKIFPDGHPNDNGEHVFVPYQYTREGGQKEWWLTAPKGRAARAAAGESNGERC